MTVNEIMGRANAAFFGNTVYSSDGRAVGTVQSVSLDQNGSWKLSVIVAGDVPTKADTFMFNVAADSVATGSVVVPVSEAQLVNTLDKQLTPTL